MYTLRCACSLDMRDGPKLKCLVLNGIGLSVDIIYYKALPLK